MQEPIFMKLGMYREDFYFVDRFHGSALHGYRCIAGCEAHTNFADESACLTADNILNEVVTQDVFKMLLHVDIFRN
jgi:hypothetical protein